MQDNKMPIKRTTASKNVVPAGKNPKKVVSAQKNVKRKAVSMHAVRSVEVVNVKKKDKSPFPWSILFTALILTSLFLFMMMNYAEVDKYRSEITELDNKISTLNKTQTELEVKLSNKYDLDDIRDYAENELDMVKKETLRSQYISIDQIDRTEMTEYDDGEEGGFGFLLTGLGEVIRDFFGG